jgi:FkbM family methyltransferase
MSLRLHRMLNRLLPARATTLGRDLALATIPSMRHLDMGMRLKNLERIGFKPNVIFDIGAASGDWARAVHAIWPAAKIVGFEPNVRERESLEKTKRDLPAFDFIQGFLGPAAGVAKYADSHTQTSLLDESAAQKATHEAQIYVLDELLASGRVPQPQFMKLDVQGFELEVLKGATTMLAKVEVVMLEVSLAKFFAGVPLIDEVSAFMVDRDFQWYDLAGALRRKNDDRLMQVDVIFAKRGHALVADGRWPT